MRSTGEIISQTVRNLLARAVSEDVDALANDDARKIYGQKLNQLADYLGVSHPYMPRKLKSGTWSAEDIDKLALYFDMFPQDFVPGSHDKGWGLQSRDRQILRQATGLATAHSKQQEEEMDG